MNGKKVAYGTLIIILSLLFFSFNYLLQKKETIFKDLNVSLYFEKVIDTPIVEEKE